MPVTLAAASRSGPPVVAPAQLATTSGATDAIISAIRSGPSAARSTCRCAGEPAGGPARPAVTTSAPAAAACRHTCRPRNPLAPRISSRIRDSVPARGDTVSPGDTPDPDGPKPPRSLVVLVGLEPGQVRRVAVPVDGLEQALVP